jgi:hypothetical protein
MQAKAYEVKADDNSNEKIEIARKRRISSYQKESLKKR